jgi:outer membrane immunogenic protein
MKMSVLTGLAGVGLVALFAGPTMAADIPPVKAPAVKVQPAYNWTGCYGGMHFGSVFTQQDWGVNGSDDDGGLVVGGQVGCDYQFSNWVIGAQGDLAWSNASGTHADGVTPALTDEWKTNALGSVTGRVGYAFDQLLPYAKAGTAWRHDNYDINEAITASETRNGWTVGGGFEHTVTRNLSMFFEYDYYDYGTRTVGFASGPIDIKDRESVVKVGANWRFNLGNQ